MRSLLMACGLGGLGALMQAWNIPGGGWVGGAAALLLALAFFRWLRDGSRGARSASSGSYLETYSGGTSGGAGSSCGTDGGSGCDGGGGDGGGGD